MKSLKVLAACVPLVAVPASAGGALPPLTLEKVLLGEHAPDFARCKRVDLREHPFPPRLLFDWDTTKFKTFSSIWLDYKLQVELARTLTGGWSCGDCGWTRARVWAGVRASGDTSGDTFVKLFFPPKAALIEFFPGNCMRCQFTGDCGAYMCFDDVPNCKHDRFDGETLEAFKERVKRSQTGQPSFLTIKGVEKTEDLWFHKHMRASSLHWNEKRIEALGRENTSWQFMNWDQNEYEWVFTRFPEENGNA